MNYKIYINIYTFFLILRTLYRNKPSYALIWGCKNAFYAHCVKKNYKAFYGELKIAATFALMLS